MIRSITGAAFAMLAATSVQAMSPAPMPRPDGMITRVAFGCGIGMTLVNGQCVARAEIRQARRAAYGVGAPYYAGVVRPATVRRFPPRRGRGASRTSGSHPGVMR